MSCKIIPRIFGGIGNQLFCYAAARRLALVSQCELAIDDISGFVRDYTYQRTYQLDHFQIPCRKATYAERLEPFSRYRRYLKRVINARCPFEKRNYIVQEGVDYDARLLQVKPRGIVYLEGYWQSQNYFMDVEEDIRNDLRIMSPEDEQNATMAKKINGCSSVVLHVRYFDEPDQNGAHNMTRDYYKRAVIEMDKLVPNAHYFIFSDRPEDARNIIPLPDEQITCVTHNQGDEMAYADLWLMTQCDHFIIANSSFSWWGAWLGENGSKQVIAPALEIRKGQMVWGFDGLLPNDWIEL